MQTTAGTLGLIEQNGIIHVELSAGSVEGMAEHIGGDGHGNRLTVFLSQHIMEPSSSENQGKKIQSVMLHGHGVTVDRDAGFFRTLSVGVHVGITDDAGALVAVGIASGSRQLHRFLLRKIGKTTNGDQTFLFHIALHKAPNR